MAKNRWGDLNPRAQRVILTTGAIEGVLKVAALVDLKRRPAQEVRGSKKRWAAAIILINAGGAVPIAYFLKGRRQS
ncbi:MAG: hypothetical protein JWQ32_1318 [Marmoricola sp.]|nr:hypothetical protein [Marmoricola sp.]